LVIGYELLVIWISEGMSEAQVAADVPGGCWADMGTLKGPMRSPGTSNATFWESTIFFPITDN